MIPAKSTYPDKIPSANNNTESKTFAKEAATKHVVNGNPRIFNDNKTIKNIIKMITNPGVLFVCIEVSLTKSVNTFPVSPSVILDKL
jgi:hypothetical protein